MTLGLAWRPKLIFKDQQMLINLKKKFDSDFTDNQIDRKKS